jgi:Na+/H+ antiporter NhaD/arsenite permease-like protein
MAITLDVTGILQAAAFWVSNKGGNNGRKLYFYFYLLLTFISMVVGNDPVILSGTAFLVYYTAATNLEPVAWLISEFAAANTASMVLFVGNPTNVVICEGFRINNAAFTAYTILPFIACSVACYAALSFQFRDGKHVPRKLNITGILNVREVLRDPVSAVFGGILLLTCLVVVIVLSFIHIDVWKVVLPFAASKFIFDLSWDHYRYSNGHIPKFGDKLANPNPNEDAMFSELKRATTMPTLPERSSTLESHNTTPELMTSSAETRVPETESPSQSSATISDNVSPTSPPQEPRIFPKQREKLDLLHKKLSAHFPTFFTALPRLPFGLIPFAFSQFILIEALAAQGWINVFATWLVKASSRQMIPTVWLIGVLGVILCNIAGTNIGATILLTKIVHAAQLPASSERAAAIALAVSSNIGAVSFTFSASLAGLLWQSILQQKGITIKQATFAFWNMLPILMMTSVGLAVVTAIMVVLY